MVSRPIPKGPRDVPLNQSIVLGDVAAIETKRPECGDELCVVSLASSGVEVDLGIVCFVSPACLRLDEGIQEC